MRRFRIATALIALLVIAAPQSALAATAYNNTLLAYHSQGISDNQSPNQGVAYSVSSGDTLWDIANRFGTSVETLRQANPTLTGDLRPGQSLSIPGTQNAWSSQSAPAVTGNDLDLLARMVYAEAGGEPFEGQVAVAAVALNRLEDPAFPGSLAAIIYEPGAFESVSNGQINQSPDESAFRAAQQAIDGWDPSGGATFFFNPAKTSNAWIWSRQIVVQLGNHVFAI